jgi:phosphoglycolate phosphatase-like HAD superfamily hydrolase
MNPVCHSSRPGYIWILDIDGTLMPSQHVDNQCYWRAVFECFGETPRTLDLHQFAHVTDSSILDEWMQQTRGRSATEGEVQQIRQRFLQLIQQACIDEPATFAASAGLALWLQQQLVQFGACVAIATGGWSHTARFKLQAAGLGALNLPLASSDDGISRCDIMRHAQSLLRAGADAGSDLITCYIGDGIWDLQASQQLGWEFIGIAQGEQARTLRQAGAQQVFCNFEELAASNSSSATTRIPLRNAHA